jgi:hypothetical protein
VEEDENIFLDQGDIFANLNKKAIRAEREI